MIDDTHSDADNKISEKVGAAQALRSAEGLYDFYTSILARRKNMCVIETKMSVRSCRLRRSSWLPFILFVSTCWPSLSFGQRASFTDLITEESATPQPLPAANQRILGIIPNSRTSPTLKEYEPLSIGEKFEIARQESFTVGTVILAAAFAADNQLTDANASFGKGGRGYARYFGASYGNLVIGNYMSEAIYPTLLHQDPRYFRRGIGSIWSRLGYSTGQIFWTRTDSDRTQINYSELLGQSTAVAISNLYYPANRSPTSSTTKLGMQIGVDMASNILREFWPDISRSFSRKPR